MTCFDVGTLPFVLDDFTLGSSFLKIFDYLSVSCPVVSTNLPAAQRAQEEFSGWIQIAGTRQDWVKAIENMLSAKEAHATPIERPDLHCHTVAARVGHVLAALAESSVDSAS